MDKSDVISLAREIVRDNEMDSVITLMVEEIELPVQSVDIIISEWMGYCLVNENMLKSVLFAR